MTAANLIFCRSAFMYFGFFPSTCKAGGCRRSPSSLLTQCHDTGGHLLFSPHCVMGYERWPSYISRQQLIESVTAPSPVNTYFSSSRGYGRCHITFMIGGHLFLYLHPAHSLLQRVSQLLPINRRLCEGFFRRKTGNCPFFECSAVWVKSKQGRQRADLLCFSIVPRLLCEQRHSTHSPH